MSARVFDSLTHLVTASSWSYAIILGIAALDAVFPLVPSEATMIVAGILAASGKLTLALVIAAGAAGAVLGDCVSYWAGRKLGRPVTSRLFRGRKAQRRLEWAEGHLSERGGLLVIGSRFIPGGRTAVTFTAGLVHFSWPLFLLFDLVAGAVWASYAALLGSIGGRIFEERPLLALLVAFGLAAVLTVGLETYRRFGRS